MRALRLSAWAGLLAAGGCDPQATPDYTGESMARVRGVMASDVADVPDGLVPLLSWDGSFVATPIDVEVSFPSRFAIDFYQPPVDEAIYDLPAMSDRPGEARLAFGTIELLPLAVAEDGRYPLGVAERHVILYAEEDVVPGTLGAEIVGAALPAGYHVLQVVDAAHPSCRRDFDCLRYSSLDLETSIEVRIDWAENLDRPFLGIGDAGPEDDG